MALIQMFLHDADDDFLDDDGDEAEEVGDDSGWGDSAGSPQQSQQTQHGSSAMQTSEHSQVDPRASPTS